MDGRRETEVRRDHGHVGGFASWVKSLCARVSVWLILILLLCLSVLWKVASKASDIPTILLCLFSFHPSLNKPSLVETALPGSSTKEGLPALPPHQVRPQAVKPHRHVTLGSYSRLTPPTPRLQHEDGSGPSLLKLL